MRRLFGTVVLASLAVLPACRGGGHARWENSSAVDAETLEVQVDASGRHTEVEYHISPDRVPAAVRKAMDRLHPGSAFDDAEKESHRGKLYYELSRKVNGMEVEAMFTPDGVLYSEEIQIPASKVPEVVRSHAMSALSGGQATKWEEIRDGKREVTAYHVKMSRGRSKFKLMFAPDGKLEGIVREVPSEIEVPVEMK